MTNSEVKLIFPIFVGWAVVVAEILVGIEEGSTFTSLYFLFIAWF